MANMTESKRKFFDGIAPQWDSFDHPPDAAEKQAEFVRLATRHQPARILDVGCGTGVLVPHLRCYCPSASIVELDFSCEMLAVNRAKHGTKGIEYSCEDLAHALFHEANFDAILFFNTLPHFESLDCALLKAASLLKRGGRIAVGHLMGSNELNAFHSSVEGPVAHDRLLPASQLAEALVKMDLSTVQSEERPDWYFVLAEKT